MPEISVAVAKEAHWWSPLDGVPAKGRRGADAKVRAWLAAPHRPMQSPRSGTAPTAPPRQLFCGGRVCSGSSASPREVESEGRQLSLRLFFL